MQNSESTLSGLWDRYGFDRPRDLTPVSGSGTDNETWIVTRIGGERIVLRRYAPSFQEDQLRLEHRVLAHLKEVRFPCAPPLAAPTGETFVQLQGRYYALFEYCQGLLLRRPLWRWFLTDRIPVAGRTLALYHRLMEGFHPAGLNLSPGFRYPDSVQLLARCREILASKSELSSFDRYVRDRLQVIEDRWIQVRKHLEGNESLFSDVLMHNDFGPPNIFFKGRRIVAVLDFSNARFGKRISDFAYALISFSKWRGPTLHGGLLRGFFEAYQAEYPLRAEELEFLFPWMMSNRLSNLCWLLVQHYQNGRSKAAGWFVDNFELLLWLERYQGRWK